MCVTLMKTNVTCLEIAIGSSHRQDSLEQKLGVRYIGGVEEKERRKKKRKEAFQSQVKACVKLMQVLQPEIIVFIGHFRMVTT